MSLDTLNNDIIGHIGDYLLGKDALHLSLTAQCLYDLTIHRVGVTFSTDKRSMLRSFHALIVHGTPSRALAVRSLVLCSTAFEADDGEDCFDDPHRPVWKRATSRSAVQELVDIFTSACNLRRLSIESIYSLVKFDIRVAPALAALCHLKHVECYMLGPKDKVVKFLGRTCWDLHTLSLDYSDRPHGRINTTQYATWINTFPPLIQTIAAFPNLHTLKIRGCPSSNFYQAHPTPNAVFSSIRRLFVWSRSMTSGLDIADRCPNFECAQITADMGHGKDIETRVSTSSGWPRLRALRCTFETLLAVCSRDHPGLGMVDYLWLLNRFDAIDDPSENAYLDWGDSIYSLLCIFRRVSPVWIQLRVAICDSDSFKRFWEQVSVCASRLRYLDLGVSIPQLLMEHLNWLDDLPNALWPVPLVYLRLHVSKLPLRHAHFDENTKSRCMEDRAGNVVWDTSEEDTFALWNKRAISMKTLPQMLARAIPTLKYVELVDGGKNLQQVIFENEGRWITPEDPLLVSRVPVVLEKEYRHRKDDDVDGLMFSSGWPEEQNASKPTVLMRSWRVVRGGGGNNSGDDCCLEPLPDVDVVPFEQGLLPNLPSV